VSTQLQLTNNININNKQLCDTASVALFLHQHLAIPETNDCGQINTTEGTELGF
jgi:hypothetical protein